MSARFSALLLAGVTTLAHASYFWPSSATSADSSSWSSDVRYQNVSRIDTAGRRLQFCPGGYSCNGGCCDSYTVTCCGQYCCFSGYPYCNNGSCSSMPLAAVIAVSICSVVFFCAILVCLRYLRIKRMRAYAAQMAVLQSQQQQMLAQQQPQMMAVQPVYYPTQAMAPGAYVGGYQVAAYPGQMMQSTSYVPPPGQQQQQSYQQPQQSYQQPQYVVQPNPLNSNNQGQW